MQRLKFRAALIIGSIVLAACAQLGAMDMREAAEIGMDRQQALGRIVGNPTAYSLKSGDTEYVLFPMMTSFGSMYSENPYEVFFIRFENDKVVDRGHAGASEEKEIQQVDPAFVLKEWKARGQLPERYKPIHYKP